MNGRRVTSGVSVVLLVALLAVALMLLVACGDPTPDGHLKLLGDLQDAGQVGLTQDDADKLGADICADLAAGTPVLPQLEGPLHFTAAQAAVVLADGRAGYCPQ